MHDARVAARRLFAVGELWLPELPERDKLLARLSKVVSRLGGVRNLDVAVKNLEEGPESDAGVRAAIAKKVRKKRKEERRQLADWLTQGRIRRLRNVLARSVAGSSAAGPSAPPGLAPRLKAVLALAARGRPMDDPDRAHELRREIRFLRYQFESIAAAYSPHDRGGAEKLFERLQEEAGSWHDRFLLDRLAAKFEKTGKRPGEAAAYRERLAGEMRALAGRFEKSLADLVALKSVLLGRVRRDGGRP